MIHSTFTVQLTCLTVFLHNLSLRPLLYLLLWNPPRHTPIHFFTQSLLFFCNKCPHHCNLFCCSIEIMTYIPSLSLNSLLGILFFTSMLHIHLTSLCQMKCHLIFFPYRPGLTSVHHTTSLTTDVVSSHNQYPYA